MKNILLTGGSGFVGRQVARALLDRGHRLTLVLRPGGFERTGLKAGDATVIETPDLFAEDMDWWRGHLKGIDGVIHAAWYVEPGKYLDSTANIDCLAGSLRLGIAAKDMGVRRFIGVGTCFEYRLPDDHITTDAPLGPVTLYAAAKLALMRMLEKRFAGSATQFAWARLFYLHGEGENPARLFPTLHRKLSAGETMHLSSADKIRDFLDTRTAGALIASLVDGDNAGPVNICSGKAVTIREIAEKIADQYGRRDLLSFGSATVHPRDPQAVVGVPSIILPNEKGPAVAGEAQSGLRE